MGYTRSGAQQWIRPDNSSVCGLRLVYNTDNADYAKVILAGPLLNSAVVGAMFLAFMSVGTVLFVRSERNR